MKNITIQKNQIYNFLSIKEIGMHCNKNVINLITFFCIFFFFSCATPLPPSANSKSNLTPGMITTKLKKGKSNKAQAMQIFGPPELITSENGIEMWGYDKISSESANSTFGIWNKDGRNSFSTKSVFLLMYFRDDILIDYKLSVTKF
jgi:hypothetical protein